ncbi:MAG: porin family protein [Pseudolabrys sp.]|nr:porin family protein [Pseudolabrys sp.]
MKLNLIRTGIFVAALALPFVAQAADLPAPSYKAPAYISPSFSWSGFYVGLNAGYGFGKSTWDIPPVSPDPKGFLAGVTLGYNLQTGTWVWGLEGDLDWSNMKGSVACGAGTCETKNSWFGTARGRIGYAGWSNWLPYITAGAAFGDIKATNSLVGSATKTKVGWTVGLGVEYALFSNWSVKAEYLYADLGSFDCGASCGGPGVTTDNVSFKTNIIRAGLNYRF